MGNRRDGGSEFFRNLVNPEGNVIDEKIVINPMTGQVMRIRREQKTSYTDKGTPEIITRELPVQCICGDVISKGKDLAFCAVGGEPVCRLHSVTDPFCGATLCLMHSKLVAIDNSYFRLCEACAKQVKIEKIKRAIKKFFLGR